MALASAETVGLLALTYAELSSPATSSDDASGLLVKMATDTLTDLDALIVDAMGKLDQLCGLLVELAWWDPLRYEALLHAWPFAPDPPPDGLPWQQYSRDRWDEVEAAMRLWLAQGITASRDVVNELAQDFYEQATAARIG